MTKVRAEGTGKGFLLFVTGRSVYHAPDEQDWFRFLHLLAQEGIDQVAIVNLTRAKRRTTVAFAMLYVLLLGSHMPAPAQKVFRGCPMPGNAVQADNKRLNAQKNRYDLPARGTRYHRIRIEDVLLRGPDRDRFPAGVPAEMVGFVRLVKEGSKETCNCHGTDDDLTDTHIELVPGEGRVLNHPRRAVVVEVSPRVRELRRAEGKVWDTAVLKEEIEGRWVRGGGWLLYDHEHTENADATNPRGKRIYKGGNWEWKVIAITGASVGMK